MDLTNHLLDIIQEIDAQNPYCMPTFNEKEIYQVIKSLNSGKSPDELGLTDEQLNSNQALLRLSTRGQRSVSFFLGKLFETVILNRLVELNRDQSRLQLGSTKGLSMTFFDSI